MTSISDHDSYIDNASESLRPLLRNLRKQLSSVLADAEEIIAYDMPGFKIGDTVIAGYAAFTKQCGIYLSAGAISSLADEIAEVGLKATKTGVTFSPAKPIPDELIKKLALASRQDHGV
jgi:uncharacterized protein YdhG (YjbR/CyaY superfamily)